MTILIILVLIVLLGGGGYFGYGRYGYSGLGGVVGIVLIIVVILLLTGTLGSLHAQQRPVPVLKSTTPTTGYDHPSQPTAQPPYQGWQRFKGATNCTQVGTQLTCDNGYKATVR